ncbi:hypothetical protein L0F63_002860 [Massospora cicadina]|nr:hypothetical protein L0F63_002860 [Massospora cicadina]
MFKKQHQIKTTSPLRSSDRRKFILELQAALKLDLSDEELNQLVPKDTLSSKFMTYNKEHGVLYSVEKEPAFFRISNLLAPTVYILWKLPNLLPRIFTNAFVLSKLIEGADLMIPGIHIPPDGLPDLKQGELVSICVIGEENQDLRHFQDLLQGSKAKPGAFLAETAHELNPEVANSGDDSPQTAAELKGSSEQNASPGVSEAEDRNTAEEVDLALMSAVYQCLSVSFDNETSKPLLPILLNTFYSTYVLPSRQVEVDIKASSWKKLAKFGKALEKHRLLSLKDIKGNLYVKSINYDHPGLKEYRPFKPPKEPASVKEPAPANSAFAPITTVDLYKVGDTLKALFPGNSPNQCFTASEVRDIFYAYCAKEELIDQSNARINPVLCDALLEKHEYFEIDVLAKDLLLKSKDAKVPSDKNPGEEPRIAAGEPKPVKLTVATRRGHKQVTLVTNFELYGFDGDQLVKDFQTLCASSVSGENLPLLSLTVLASTLPSKGNPAKEIVVQGPQQKLLTKYFTERGLPARLLALETTIKKK